MINENVITNPRLLNFENMCSEKNIDYSYYIELVEFLQARDDHIVVNKIYTDYDDYDEIFEPTINSIIRDTMYNTDKNYIMKLYRHLVLIKSSYNELDNMDTVDDVMYNGKTLHIYTKYIGGINDENFIYYNRLYDCNNDVFDKFKLDVELFNYLKALYNDKLHDSFDIIDNKYHDIMIIVPSWEDYDYSKSKSIVVADWGDNDILMNELEKYPEECEFFIENSYKLIYSKYELDEEPKGKFAEYISHRIEFACRLHTFSCEVKTNSGYEKEYILTQVDDLLTIEEV